MTEYLEQLKKEYAEQDNRATAYPIYVTVQELICIGLIEDGYSVNCPYGDGETLVKYRLCDGDCEAPEFSNSEELKKYYEEELGEKKIKDSDIQEYNLGYIWHPVEFFLTLKGAEEYIAANRHNHGKLRTYVHHFEWRNFEMNKLLEELDFKVKS